MPRALLFGFEGALIDETGLRAEVVRGVLAEEGIERISGGEVGACPESLDESVLESIVPLPPGAERALLVARLNARISVRYQALLRERGPRWIEGATEFVERVAGRGLSLGLLAHSAGDRVRAALSDAGLGASFKVVVAAEDSEEVMSRVESYRLALSRLNTLPPLPERLFHPHQVAALEGTKAGLRAAASAGLRTVALGVDPVEGLEADLWCASYSDLRLTAAGIDGLG